MKKNCVKPLDCRPPVYPAFELCLPFGSRLIYDGLGLRLEQSAPLPDGVYGFVVVRNGCLANLLEAEVPSYTPPPCVPAPVPCDGEPGPATAVVISPLAGNLLGFDLANRLLAQLFAEPGNNIQVSGAGTSQDPLKISAHIEPTVVSLTSTSDVLEVDGANNSFSIRHVQTTGPLVMGGFTFDRFGHVQEYNAPPVGTEALTKIKSSNDENLLVKQEGPVAIITLPPKFQDNRTFTTGAEEVTVDPFGRVVDIAPAPGGGDPTIANRFCRIFEGNRTTFFHQFETTASGRFRFSYRGDLGIALAGRGLAPLPTGVELSLDGQSLAGWAVVEGGQVVGFEALASNSSASGQHLFNITLGNSISAPGLLDISLCR